MKKIDATWKCLIIIVLILALQIAGIKAVIKNTVNNCYEMPVVVYAVNAATDSVIVEDNNGNLWEFGGVENFEVGKACIVIMDSCGTNSIYDDEIVRIIH